SFFLTLPHHPTSTLFPYTTLFRSKRTPRHFFLQTSAAERTDCRSVGTDKHPCPGTPVARTLRAYQGGQRQRLAAVEFEGAENVDDFFHCRAQQNVRGDSESRFRNVKSTYRV